MVLLSFHICCPSDLIAVIKMSNTFFFSDHNYAFPSTLPAAKTKCDTLQSLVDVSIAKEAKKQRKIKETMNKLSATESRLSAALQLVSDNKILQSQEVSFLQNRFSGVQLEVVQSLLAEHRGKRNRYPPEARDFAVTLYYYSPKAYRFISSLLTLPSPRTIRSYVGSIGCWPGFQTSAINELKAHSNDKNYSDASMSIDGMSIKELIQFDAKLGHCFGYVDLGGHCSAGEGQDIPANESLVVMLVGLRSYWKLPIAWFLIKGISAEILAGIIREALCICHEAGVAIRSVCMDGTVHNITAFNKLGCNLQPENIDEVNT